VFGTDTALNLGLVHLGKDHFIDTHAVADEIEDILRLSEERNGEDKGEKQKE